MPETATALERVRPALAVLLNRAQAEPSVAQHILSIWLGNRAERTLEAYQSDLRAFALHLRMLGPEGQPNEVWALEELLAHGRHAAQAALLTWRAAMLAAPPRKPGGSSGLSPATINRRLAAVRSFLGLADQLGAIDWGAAVRVPGVKQMLFRDTRGPGDAGFRRLLLAAQRQAPEKAARDVAILRCFHDLALRRSELLSLHLEHLELGGDHPACLWVRRKGKTQTTRLTLPERTLDALRAWLRMRGDQPGPLWRSFDRRADGPQALSSAGLYHLVRWLGSEVDIKLWPHGLRHLSITKAIALAGERGRPIADVLPHSGHAKGSLHLLLVYRDQLDDEAGEVAAWVAEATPTPAS